MTTEPASLSHHHQPLPLPLSPARPTLAQDSPATSSSPKPVVHKHPSKSDRRHSLPFSFPPLFFQPANSSSASLVPSTAEGKPIPLDGGSAAHRTTALRELHSSYPSPVNRRGYAKSSGAQSSTYSQPVIVRTYSGPSTSRGSSYNSPAYHIRPSSATRSGSRRIPLPTPSSGASPFLSNPVRPAINGIGNGLALDGSHFTSSNGSENGRRIIARMPPGNKPKKGAGKLPWQWRLPLPRHGHDEARLPPLEAFSFKSVMADLQDQEHDGGGGGINADLDRIAEICARSRYSLSNQYEVHVAPHGSGARFINGAGAGASGGKRKGHSNSYSNSSNGYHGNEGGPTLQAINSEDDERSAKGQRRRRGGVRRKSVAYGTLETIMSSSRSSEEEKSKKKSAAEIAEEVRGRAGRKSSESASNSPASASAETESKGSKIGNGKDGEGVSSARQQTETREKHLRPRSACFVTAVMDTTRHHGQSDATASSPRSSATALVSEPSMPQTSTSHLEIRTTPGDNMIFEDQMNSNHPESSSHAADSVEGANLLILHPGDASSTGWSAWIPWRTQSSSIANQQSSGGASHAEGSLRQLLKAVDVIDKGKDVDRED